MQPLVEFHKIRKQQSSSLKLRQLLCKLEQQVEIPTLGMVLDVLRAQDTVCEFMLSGKVWIAQLQLSAKWINMTTQLRTIRSEWWRASPNLMSTKSLFSQSCECWANWRR